MSTPIGEAVWIMPDGVHAQAPVPGAVADGWIGIETGEPTQVHVRAGAVDVLAARALGRLARGLDPDMPVACDRGDGALRDVVAEIQRTAWALSREPGPEAALVRVLGQLAEAASEAATARWLRAGLDAGGASDREPLDAALSAMGTLESEASREVARTPEALKGTDAAQAGTAAAAWTAQVAALQERLEASWHDVAGAACGASGRPAPLEEPDPNGLDPLRALRAALARAHELRPLGLSHAWAGFPEGSPVPRALERLRSGLGLPRRHIAAAAALAVSGEEPARLVSRLGFLLQHECARTYSVNAHYRRELSDAVEASSRTDPAP